MKIEAATADLYRVSLPSGETGFLPARHVVDASNAIRNVTFEKRQPLLDEPNMEAAKKMYIPLGQLVSIHGFCKEFYLVTTGKSEGWVPFK